MSKVTATLPKYFCWTRFGTEAGETIENILARKEQERLENNGIFLWGIGNALGPSIRELLLLTPRPQVVFSPIKSPPKTSDVEPQNVAVWTKGRTLDGTYYNLPQGSLVTSRYEPNESRNGHYALVCFSASPLSIDDLQLREKINARGLCNLMSGRPIGASQVTAVVRRMENDPDSVVEYSLAIRAELVAPYFIKLINPLQIPSNVRMLTGHDWTRALRRLLQEDMHPPLFPNI
jgi:hypothetical protein